jgi:hypothetical protein
MCLKRAGPVPLALFALVAVSGTAHGYGPPASYSWLPGTPGYDAAAVLHTGTINTGNLVMGDYVGRDSGQLYADGFGTSGVAVGWDDNWTSGGHNNTNGDRLDGFWVQIFSSGGWWDLGQASRYVAGFTSQDHGPYLGEGLEYRIFGSNTLWGGTLSPQARLTDVYLDGWRTHNAAEDANGNGWLSDDISGVFDLQAAYRYVKVVSWDPSGAFGEPEVDGIARVVPEPASLLLLSMMLLGGAAVRSRKRR